MVKGAKVATTYRKAKKVASVGLSRVDSSGQGEKVDEFVAGPRAQSEDSGFSVVGVGKLWLLHSGAQSQAKDRGIVPPALPVPIASFTI